MPEADTRRWKLLDAVSTPNLESFARCLTGYSDVNIAIRRGLEDGSGELSLPLLRRVSGWGRTVRL